MSLPLPVPRPAAAASNADAAVECPSCGQRFATPHCPQCGERRPEPTRLALGHLIAEAVEQFVSFDGTFVRTLVTLVRRPGALTEAYLRGSRVRYTRPVQLFVILNVAFFLAAPRLGLLRYGYPVPRHPTTALEQARVERGLAQTPAGRIALRRMRESHERWDQFVPRYNAAVDARISSLIGLLFVVPCVTLGVVCARRGQYVAAHAVFMLHFAAFALIWMPAAALVGEKLAVASGWAPNVWIVTAFVALVVGPLLAYLAVAIRRVYGGGRAPALARALAVTAALAPGGALFAVAIRVITAWLL